MKPLHGARIQDQNKPMLLLDTSGALASIALAAQDGDLWTITAQESLSGRTASERLIPVLRGMLQAAGQTAMALAAVAVVHGPGSFTGVRVGLSAAKALCEAASIPLIAISRLAILSSAAQAVPPDTLVHAVLDAGRGELFHGAYRSGICEGEDLLSLPSFLARVTREPGTVFFCEPILAAPLGAISTQQVPEPTAAAALAIAAVRLQFGDSDDPALLDANYLRHTEDEIRQRVAIHLASRPSPTINGPNP